MSSRFTKSNLKEDVFRFSVGDSGRSLLRRGVLHSPKFRVRQRSEVRRQRLYFHSLTRTEVDPFLLPLSFRYSLGTLVFKMEKNLNKLRTDIRSVSETSISSLLLLYTYFCHSRFRDSTFTESVQNFYIIFPLASLTPEDSCLLSLL